MDSKFETKRQIQLQKRRKGYPNGETHCEPYELSEFRIKTYPSKKSETDGQIVKTY